jgi:hypothetical protein
MNPRLLFRPKHAPLKEQCVSCPFRDGNDTEFAQVIQKLDPTLKGKKLLRHTLAARLRIRDEAKTIGEFSCHHTAYDADMNLRPERERRQCPGATTAYVAAGEGAVAALRHGSPPDYDRDEKHFTVSQSLLASGPYTHIERMLKIDLTHQEPGELTESQLMWLANAPLERLQPYVAPIYRMLSMLGFSAFIPLDNARAAEASR